MVEPVRRTVVFCCILCIWILILIDFSYWPKLSDWLKNIGAGSYEKNRPDRWPLHERGGALQSVGAVEWRRHAGFYLHRAHERCGERPELRCGAGYSCSRGKPKTYTVRLYPLAAVTAAKEKLTAWKNKSALWPHVRKTEA